MQHAARSSQVVEILSSRFDESCVQPRVALYGFYFVKDDIESVGVVLLGRRKLAILNNVNIDKWGAH